MKNTCFMMSFDYFFNLLFDFGKNKFTFLGNTILNVTTENIIRYLFFIIKKLV